MRKSNTQGSYYWAPSPFHGEKTASFHVTEPKGHGGQFFCLGCNAKGSVISFLMVRGGLSFAVALRDLADQEGIETILAVLAATRLRNPDFKARVEAALSLGALSGPEAKTDVGRGKSAYTGKRLPSPLPELRAWSVTNFAARFWKRPVAG